MFSMMIRLSMIAHLHKETLSVVRNSFEFAKASPVALTAEEAMEDDHGFGLLWVDNHVGEAHIVVVLLKLCLEATCGVKLRDLSS